MAMTEDELFPIWRDATGDEKKQLTTQLAKLLERHANAIVYLTLGKHLKEPVNEAVYRALTRADSFKGESKFSTWFHSLTQRIAIDYARKAPKGEEELDETFSTGEELEARTIERIDVERTIQRLPIGDRALVEFKQQGLSDKEIAKLLNVHPTTIHYRWKKIREKIRCRI